MYLQPQEHHPHRQNGGGNIIIGGVFLQRGPDKLHRIKRMMDGAKYRQGQAIEKGSWMVFQHDNDTKTHGTKATKEWLRKRSTLRFWSGLASLQTLIHRTSL